MNNVTSLEAKEKAKIFQTILSSPGMNQKCKIVLNISRQNVLLLGRLLESGLLSGNDNLNDEIISVLSKESLEDFKEIHSELLMKADLSEFYEKLKSI